MPLEAMRWRSGRRNLKWNGRINIAGIFRLPALPCASKAIWISMKPNSKKNSRRALTDEWRAQGKMDFRKKENIATTQQQVGWAYPDMRWFSEEEAREANRQRNELLNALSGWINLDFQGSKPHTGPLSPACLICGEGSWGCNYINGLCTHNCFYCPQDRAIKEERPPMTDGRVFNNPEDHVRYLKTFKFRGVGFSGGEPLLVLDRLLAHIAAIRQAFGESMYLWVYTNGSLADRSTLRDLERAGLDEIRFDISARNYDLARVALAMEYFSTVTVEIPAIPEDLERLKGLLSEMQALGVSFLNLHQLDTTEHNFKALCRRNYYFLHQPTVPVFDSEICALRLLLFAREQQIRLPINYCGAAYKDRFQRLGIARRLATAVLNGSEEISDAGYIRSFRVSDSRDQIEAMVRRLGDVHCATARWECDRGRSAIAIHSELLSYIDWTSADVTLQYSMPGVQLRNPADGFAEGNLVPAHQVVYQEHGWSQAAIECWRKLFVAKINAKDAFREFYRDYPAPGKDAIVKAQEEADRLNRLCMWEELETGLPEIY
jgi:uncharacterized protein